MSEKDIQPDDALSQVTAQGTSSLGSAYLLDDAKHQSHESVGPQNSYQIKPNFQDIFKEIPVKDIIRNVQVAVLEGKSYDADYAKKWTIKIANEVNEKVKEIEMKRYRHIVQVVLGERKGQGVKSGVRCVWDPEIDACCSEIFMNVKLPVLYC